MSTVMVTGGAGFIGSHLVDRLIEEGHTVYVVDDLSNGELEFVNPKCNFILSDYSADAVLNLIKKKQFDVVFHLAAKPRVSYSVDYPAETTDINVNRFVKLLEACRGNVKRFINTSSSSVYGGASKLPTPESYPFEPKSPYALQKAVTEHYCTLFSDLYGLDTASVRPFNVFGPRQKGDGPYGTAVSNWLKNIKEGQPLRSDGDGQQSRDLSYVSNVVDVFYRVMMYPNRLNGAGINAGTGSSITNNEVLTKLKTKFPQLKVINAPVRAGDVKHTKADMSAANRLLGHKTLVEFWDGLELTIKSVTNK